MLFNQSWIKGQVESVHLTCEDDFFPMAEDSLSMVLYLQDERTGEILQAATIPEYSTVSVPGAPAPLSLVRLYPNPAGERVHIYFEKVPETTLGLTFYDLSGKPVFTDVIHPLEQHYTRSLGGLEKGLYIVEVRSYRDRQVLYRDKLLHY
jgi:hypothetical protein